MQVWSHYSDCKPFVTNIYFQFFFLYWKEFKKQFNALLVLCHTTKSNSEEDEAGAKAEARVGTVDGGWRYSITIMRV